MQLIIIDFLGLCHLQIEIYRSQWAWEHSTFRYLAVVIAKLKWHRHANRLNGTEIDSTHSTYLAFLNLPPYSHRLGKATRVELQMTCNRIGCKLLRFQDLRYRIETLVRGLIQTFWTPILKFHRAEPNPNDSVEVPGHFLKADEIRGCTMMHEFVSRDSRNVYWTPIGSTQEFGR